MKRTPNEVIDAIIAQFREEWRRLKAEGKPERYYRFTEITEQVEKLNKARSRNDGR